MLPSAAVNHDVGVEPRSWLSLSLRESTHGSTARGGMPGGRGDAMAEAAGGRVGGSGSLRLPPIASVLAAAEKFGGVVCLGASMSLVHSSVMGGTIAGTPSHSGSSSPAGEPPVAVDARGASKCADGNSGGSSAAQSSAASTELGDEDYQGICVLQSADSSWACAPVRLPALCVEQSTG